MSKFTKLVAAIALAGSVSGCVGTPDASLGNAATGAALGASAAIIAGGSRTDAASAAAIGALAGAAIPAN